MKRNDLFGVVIENVDVVYHAAGRRWLTLNGACRAAAREQVSEHLKENIGEEYRRETEIRLLKIIKYLAKRQKRRYYKNRIT